MPLATNNDALREFAFNVGRDLVHHEFLLHDSDTWVKNPHFVGSNLAELLNNGVNEPEQDLDDSLHWQGDEPGEPDDREDYEPEQDFDCDDFDDGQALASAGFGTDEDYGSFNDDFEDYGSGFNDD